MRQRHLDRFRFIPGVKTGNEKDSFFFGKLGGFEDAAHAGRIDGTWFLRENMFSRINRCSNVQRPKRRWRCQQHDIDVGGEQLFVRIESNESHVGLDRDPIADLFLALE